MTTIISNIEFGNISNVRKSYTEENVYFVDVEMSVAEGFPLESCEYVARADDYALTGKWVYKQVLNGNFIGEITLLNAGDDPATSLPYISNVGIQPTTTGTQTL